MTEMVEMTTGAGFVADRLFVWWQKGVDFGHGMESGKIDLEDLVAAANEIASKVIEEHIQSKETPEQRARREGTA